MCECRLAHWMCLWCGLMWEWPFSGFPCVAGAIAVAMCERWLAHSRCLWCGWIRGWAVFGVSLCVGCCFVRRVLLWWLCVSGGCHIGGCVGCWPGDGTAGVAVFRGCCPLGASVAWLCVGGGWHIGRGGGVGGVGIGLFSGFLCAAGTAVVVMCEWWLAHCGVDGVLVWCRVCGSGCFLRLLCVGSVCCLAMCEWWLAHCGAGRGGWCFGYRCWRLCVSGGWRLSAVGMWWRGLQSA